MPEGDKSYIVTLLLSYFLGLFGADRFYLGKPRSALVKLFTLGGFGYWWIIDVLITLCGGQRDQWGLRLDGYDRHKKTVWFVVGAIFGASLALGILTIVVSAAFDRDGPTTFGWALANVLGVVVAGGGVTWFLKHRARTKPTRGTRTVDTTPSRIRALIQKLIDLRGTYVVYAATGDEVAAALIPQLDSLVSNTTQFFTRLATKADKAQRARAEAEYVDKLGKLTAALDHDYLLDVLTSPRLWDEPDQRVRDVQRAVDAVDAQLLDNIRQVNAHRGLVFQVGIDGLIGPRKAMDDWQRDFDKAAGTE